MINFNNKHNSGKHICYWILKRDYFNINSIIMLNERDIPEGKIANNF